ncbi:MAG TPA: hypothetical protein VN017_09440 [Pseudoxanthomonas sp.]|nr:hypothetical protein [Pseudoxanthomonas sp.]
MGASVGQTGAKENDFPDVSDGSFTFFSDIRQKKIPLARDLLVPESTSGDRAGRLTEAG